MAKRLTIAQQKQKWIDDALAAYNTMQPALKAALDEWLRLAVAPGKRWDFVESCDPQEEGLAVTREQIDGALIAAGYKYQQALSIQFKITHTCPVAVSNQHPFTRLKLGGFPDYSTAHLSDGELTTFRQLLEKAKEAQGEH